MADGFTFSGFYGASGKTSVLSHVMQTFIYEKAETVHVSINVFHTAATIRLLFFPAEQSDSFAHL